MGWRTERKTCLLMDHSSFLCCIKDGSVVNLFSLCINVGQSNLYATFFVVF